MGDRIAMSQRERDVLKVMSGVLGGERTQVEAARLLGRSVRQVRRMQRRLEEEGDGAVMHGLRGRPSDRGGGGVSGGEGGGGGGGGGGGRGGGCRGLGVGRRTVGGGRGFDGRPRSPC